MTTNYQRIYEKLGYLFYGIAMADNDLRPREVETLKQLVQKVWVPLEHSTDEFGTDAAHYIYISFDYLKDGFTTAREAYEEFAAYYQVHRAVFSDKLKAMIVQTATAIADAYRGVNKSELLYLEELEQLLASK